MSQPFDLVVFSHLRWDFVWQRPQQLISRLAPHWNTLFVEEPLPVRASTVSTRLERLGPVTRLRAEVPGVPLTPMGFDAAVKFDHVEAVLAANGGVSPRMVWLYTPIALPFAEALDPEVIVYDVMDDLAAFRHASPLLKLRQALALHEADVVFTGGRSLHKAVVRQRRGEATLFPSGIDVEHYLPARAARVPHRPAVAGYVGVIDERLDLELLAGLADALPDWRIEMVGPVAKVEAAALPQRPNISYLGARSYSELPAVMAGFDVALMPFALNEATRSISPTKTLEYLAAGLPVVSTRVPDVVSDVGDLVALADDAGEFAQACRHLARVGHEVDDPRIHALLERQRWDGIAERMRSLIESASEAASSSVSA
ncbi:MAG: glycosyltransferase [Candidatus Dormibacteria bacterium]